MKKNTKKTPKIGRWILLWLILFFVWSLFLKPYNLNEKVVVKKWDNFQAFINDFSTFQKIWLKIYLTFNKNDFDLSKIQLWTYNFEWKYSKSEFLNLIQDWPKQNFNKYTVLEGWSTYDIDLDLSNKWLINKWEYTLFANDKAIISKYKERYKFISSINKDLSSLEWFLYPDTYHLDVWWNVIDQLVYLQLDNFNKKVWNIYSWQISAFSKLSWYDIVKLSTVVEKEERNSSNKSTVAWIFFNRLDKGMRLDADITLCYGLKEPYETCKPNVIARKISDKSNVYNTRQNYWMVPQPIANPSLDSILAVLNYKKTEYLYYLHDSSGSIHYGRTLEEHNSNKKNYLN